ncbi:MAG: long-chain fatty acid--CoA ligase [Opitutaceae bacterium]|nr:long-chain fatty acid--CoA ligase [Cytophagales bacterium]
MEFTRVFDIIHFQKSSFPKSDCLADKTSGEWKTYSTEKFIEIATQLSFGLLELGIQKDDKVAIISANRVEWNFADLAIQQIGAVSVPLYPNITVEDYRFILKDSEAKIVFVANSEILTKVKEAVSDNPNIKGIYTFNHLPGQNHWSEIQDKGKSRQLSDIELFKNTVTPSDLLTIIYTSGTTGTPKGVMLTHNNIVSNVRACGPLMPVGSTDRALSFLPLCHVYERMLNYLYSSVGVSIYYAESLETISDNLKEIKPQIFVTVPRLLEKVYDKIVTKGSELTGIKKALFFWALDLGLKYDNSINQGIFYDLQLKLANKIIFNKWREALGGNVKAIVTGGAALQVRLARVFTAAQIMVMQGYGLTETSPVISVNRANLKENRFGTVGPVIDGVEVKIAEDGEILTKGPHIMKGYFKRPEVTAESIDTSGWFHTGDIGEWIDNKYLKITDRKKEIFKTSGGKYIAPQIIENKIKESKLVEQTIVIGDGQKFPAALIVPNFINLKSYCLHKGIPYSTDSAMISDKAVLEKFQREMEEANACFAQYEKIKKFELIEKMWTIDSGELTPKLSLKRKAILANNIAVIDKIYNS